MPIRIDIDGPIGNAYAILGLAKQYSDEMFFSKEKQNEIIEKMKAPGNYQGLVDGFNETFEGLVELYSYREENPFDDDEDYDDEEF